MVHEPHDNLGDGVAGEAGMPAEALHASEPAVTDRTPPTPAEIPNTTRSARCSYGFCSKWVRAKASISSHEQINASSSQEDEALI